MDWPYRTYSHSKGLFGWAYFSGELIFAGAHQRDNKVSLKQRKQSKIAAHPTVHGLIFGRAYYRKDSASVVCFGGLFSGGLIIRIIRYVVFEREK